MTPILDEDRVERAAEAARLAANDVADDWGEYCSPTMAIAAARAAITAYQGETHVDVSRGDLEYIASESSQSLIRDRARSYLSPTPAGKER